MIEMGEASTVDEREAVFRFWYSVYVAEMGRYREVADHEHRRLSGPEDERSRIFFARDGDEVVAACRFSWGQDGFTDRQIEQYQLEPFLREVPHDLLLIGERTMVAASHRGGSVYTDLAYRTTPLAEELGIALSFGASEPHLVSYYAKFGQRPYSSRQYVSEESGYIIPTMSIPFGLDVFGGDVPRCVQVAMNGSSVVRNGAVDGEERYAADLRAALPAATRPSSLFAGLTDDEILLCAARGTLLTCAAGDQVLRCGGTARNPFVVISGRLEARHDSRVTQVLEAGDLFGESGWLGGQDRLADVVVTDDGSQILALSQGNLATLEQSHPDLAVKLLANVSQSLWARLRDRNAATG